MGIYSKISDPSIENNHRIINIMPIDHNSSVLINVKKPQKIPLNILISSVLMNIISIICFILAIYSKINKIYGDIYIPLFIISFLFFIPGFYSAFVLLALKFRLKGYSTKNISVHQIL